MRRLVFLLALLLAAPLVAQPRKIGTGARLVGTPVGYATMTAPSGCVAGSVAMFLGSPVSMSCDAGLTYDAGTDALTVGASVYASAFETADVSTRYTAFRYEGAFFNSAGTVKWSSSGANWYTGVDSGLRRVSAGLIGVTSGGANLGSLQAGNFTATALGQVVGVTVTPQGANDGATYGYIVVPFLNDATWGTASAQALTVVGATVLNATDKNKIDWTALANAAYYNVYRTSGGATNGLIGTTTATTFDDTGLVAGVGVPAGNTTGRVLAGDGSAAAPSVGPASATDQGFYFSPNVTRLGHSGPILVMSGVGGAAGAYANFLTPRGLILNSATGEVTVGPTANNNEFRVGQLPSATPVANTLIIGESSRAGTDTNVAGANGTITSGAGTGSGAGSALIFQTPTPGGSGSGAQTQTTRMTIGTAIAVSADIGFSGVPYPAASDAIDFGYSTYQFKTLYLSRATLGSKSKALTDASATNFASFTIADGETYTGEVIYKVTMAEGAAGGARQALAGRVRFAATREGSTYTAVVNEVGTQLLAAAAGTLTGSISIAGAAGVVTLSANFDTSQAGPDVFKIDYRFDSCDAGLAITPL